MQSSSILCCVSHRIQYGWTQKEIDSLSCIKIFGNPNAAVEWMVGVGVELLTLRPQ